jgi:ATP-dependent RNA helicase DDX41
MPKRIQEFAKQHIDQPVAISVGIVTKPDLNVNQEIEYVKREDKFTSLLNALQKTAPPVIIFSENKSEVDLIQEYLLIKEVETVSLHGGKGILAFIRFNIKEQKERSDAINFFKEGKCDVLVSTDVAAKGLDFSNIRHVINFDMPRQVLLGVLCVT